MSGNDTEIPNAICSVVGRNLGDAYRSHSNLNALFYEAGAPGEPPEGNCVRKCTNWLKRCNDDSDIDALAVLGDVLVEFMEAWPYGDNSESKSEIERKLAEYGLHYDRGRVIAGSLAPAAKDLQTIIRSRDLTSLVVEFDRATSSVDSDPAAAITAASSIFEAFCKTYIEDEGLEEPARIGAQSLWKVVRSHIALNPTADMDRNLKQILSGLASVVDGISSLRNSSGSAHGRGRLKYRVEPRHARLSVNAAHALVLFLLEVWDHRTKTRVSDASLNYGRAGAQELAQGE